MKNLKKYINQETVFKTDSKDEMANTGLLKGEQCIDITSKANQRKPKSRLRKRIRKRPSDGLSFLSKVCTEHDSISTRVETIKTENIQIEKISLDADERINSLKMPQTEIYIPSHRLTDIILPARLQKLNRLYTILQSIIHFNNHHDLTTIHVQIRKNVEDLLGNTLLIEDLECINHLTNCFTFKPIQILHLGKLEDTFLITAESKIDFKETLRSLSSAEMENLARKPLYDYKLAEPRVVEKPVSKAEIKAPSNAALTILERIRAREQMRKDQFIAAAENTEKLEKLGCKIELFMKTEKIKSIEVSRLIRILSIGSRDELSLVCSKFDFEIINFKEVEYFKTKSKKE